MKASEINFGDSYGIVIGDVGDISAYQDRSECLAAYGCGDRGQLMLWVWNIGEYYGRYYDSDVEIKFRGLEYRVDSNGYIDGFGVWGLVDGVLVRGYGMTSVVDDISGERGYYVDGFMGNRILFRMEKSYYVDDRDRDRILSGAIRELSIRSDVRVVSVYDLDIDVCPYDVGDIILCRDVMVLVIGISMIRKYCFSYWSILIDLIE